MNSTTLFLAQIWGPVLLFMGLGMVLNPKFYSKVMQSFEKECFAMMLASMGMIAAGVAMAVKHFLWGSFAEGLVSVLGLGMLLKGVVVAIFPGILKGWLGWVVSKDLLRWGGLIWVLGGGYLCWVGFWG